jgi:hypothetical protein
MNDNYLIWNDQLVDGACGLSALEGLDDSFRLNNGTPLKATLPADISFSMNPDYPNDIALIDSVFNIDRVIVASKRLQQCINAYSPPEVEVLPVKIINHKGRVASSEYAIIHPVNPVDCIDRRKSKFEADGLNPDDIESFRKLVIDEKRIPKDRLFFRMKGFWDITLVRHDLAAALTAAKLSGVGWLRIPDYPEV